jgi:hypothetical protein
LLTPAADLQGYQEVVGEEVQDEELALVEQKGRLTALEGVRVVHEEQR